jgi:hypothetical protein
MVVEVLLFYRVDSHWSDCLFMTFDTSNTIPHWQISEETKAALKAIDDNIRNALINADRIFLK